MAGIGYVVVQLEPSVPQLLGHVAPKILGSRVWDLGLVNAVKLQLSQLASVERTRTVWPSQHESRMYYLQV